MVLLVLVRLAADGRGVIHATDTGRKVSRLGRSHAAHRGRMQRPGVMSCSNSPQENVICVYALDTSEVGEYLQLICAVFTTLTTFARHVCDPL